MAEVPNQKRKKKRERRNKEKNDLTILRGRDSDAFAVFFRKSLPGQYSHIAYKEKVCS